MGPTTRKNKSSAAPKKRKAGGVASRAAGGATSSSLRCADHEIEPADTFSRGLARRLRVLELWRRAEELAQDAMSEALCDSRTLDRNKGDEPALLARALWAAIAVRRRGTPALQRKAYGAFETLIGAAQTLENAEFAHACVARFGRSALMKESTAELEQATYEFLALHARYLRDAPYRSEADVRPQLRAQIEWCKRQAPEKVDDYTLPRRMLQAFGFSAKRAGDIISAPQRDQREKAKATRQKRKLTHPTK